MCVCVCMWCGCMCVCVGGGGGGGGRGKGGFEPISLHTNDFQENQSHFEIKLTQR